MTKGQPARGDTKGLGERLKYLDAGLTAFFNVGDGIRAYLDEAGKCSFRKLAFDPHRLQSGAHTVSACCWSIGVRVANPVRQPWRGDSEGRRQARNGRQRRNALTCLNIAPGSRGQPCFFSQGQALQTGLLPRLLETQSEPEKKRVLATAHHRGYVARADG